MAGGTYTGTQSITLTSATPGATIYYTIDGSVPSTTSTEYTGPVSVSSALTLKAIAIKSGIADSDVLTETYAIISGAVPPVAYHSGGNYLTAQSVTLTTATPGASIYYTVDGSTPSAGSTLYSGPISVASSLTLKAIAIKSGVDNSSITTESYVITRWKIVGESNFSTGQSNYIDIAFHPTTSEPYVSYTDYETVSYRATVKKFNGTSWESVGTDGFTPSRADGTQIAFNPITNEPYVVGGYSYGTVMRYTSSTWTSVGSTITGASGSSPRIYSLAFHPTSTEPYLAFSDYSGGRNGKITVKRFDGSSWVSVGSEGFSDVEVARIQLKFQPVTMVPYVVYKRASAGTPVVERFNGSDWEVISDSSFDSYNTISFDFNPTTTEPYVLTLGDVKKFNGTSWETVSLSAIDAGLSINAQIYFNPTTKEPHILFLEADKLSLKKYSNSTWSYVDVGSFTNEAVVPQFKLVFHPTTNEPYVAYTDFNAPWKTTVMYLDLDPANEPYPSTGGGSYSSTQSVTLTSATPGATIYYTIDGSTPQASSTRYTGSIAVSESQTIKAIAVKSGYERSAVMSETYTITTPTTPTVTTGATSSLAETSVTLGGNVTDTGTESVTERGFVYGTTVSYGATTSTTSPSFGTGAYTEGVTGLACETTYHYAAYARNSIGTTYGSDATFTTSECVIPQTGAPTASPTGGTYTEGKAVTLTSATPGALIFYTSDGSTPATTTSNQYTTPLSASSTVTYKAIAWASGYIESTVMTETYTITPSTTPTVTTGSAASITQSTVTLGGDITSLGTTNVTARGIIYGTTVSYGATSSASSAGFSTGAFTEDITGLVCNTAYHFVAYAVNSIGVDFGSDATFTTSDCTPIAGAPTASPDGGTYTGTQTVTLSTSTPGALIFYTSDGSTPATTTSNQYTTPLSASSTVTYKAIAWASGYDASTIMTETYTITDSEVAADKAALVVGAILGSNADADNIIVSLAALPSTGSIHGSTITWSSDTTGTISHDGQSVNRPAFVSGDQVVNLTATITKGASSDTKTFVLTVKKEPAGNVSTITSNSYTVSALGSPSETITNVPYGTAKAVFLSALFKSQSYEVFTSTGINDPVTTGDTLVVTAQDGTTVTTYTVTVASLTASQIVPDGSGIAVVNATTPEVVITDLGTTASVTIESGTSDATINLGSFIANGTGTIPAIQLTAENAHNMSIEIPASTVITSGSSTWNGILTAPTVTTITLPTESGVTKTLSTAIEIGFTGESLTFSKAVRLLIPNEAGKLAGYSISSTFTEITDTCASDSQVAGDALASGAECKIDVGPDLVIWTKHFTTFATYSETVTSSSGSSGGGGGGSGSSSRRTTTSTTTTTTSTATTTTSTTETSTTEIDRLLTLLATLKAQLSLLLKGTPSTASSVSLTRNLELGMEGEDVRTLQVYLNTHGFPVSQTGVGSLGNETTYFGPSTKAAVIRFQNSHASTLLTPINLTSGTGYVGEKTRALMNGVSSAIVSTPTVTPNVSTTPTATPVTPSTVAVPKVVAPVVQKPVVVATPVPQILKIGMVSDDVLKLQLFLNNNGFLIAYSGAGSRGQESTSFGLATEAAVIRYQNEFLDELGMTEATGVVDRVTRAHMGF